MEYLIVGLISYVIVFIYYYIFIIKSKKRNKIQQLPKEAEILTRLYKVDVKKIGYKRLLWHVSIANSLGIAFIMAIIVCFDNIWLKTGAAIGLVILFVLGINCFLGWLYKRKGWTK